VTPGPHEENEEVTTMQLTALLDTLTEDVDRARSAQIPCRVFDAELWFAESPADVERAKALCQDCPVRASCLATALERREPWGVWGGQLLIAGVVVARKRPRGRPRKNVAAA
jgi:WhiB family transcriptional regulator, redox-sensing transcriptional regulator